MSEASKGKELARKLGIKKGMSLAIMNPPYGFVQPLIEIRETLREMHTDVKMREAVDVEMFIYFTRARKGLVETFPKLMEDLKPDGTLWLGWLKPKGVRTDLDEKIVKEIAGKYGMKDVDAIALSDEWPMLKFVRAGEKK
jgi:hypothetical protein